MHIAGLITRSRSTAWRYKERRRETENRIRRTRENMAREDIRKELRAVAAFVYKSRAATRYKELKQELARAQLGLRWKE